MSDLEPNDPELARLFAAERARSAAPQGAKARGLDRLEASLVPPAPSLLARAAPTLGTFVVGGLVGAALASTLAAPKVVYVDRPVPVSSSPLAAEASVPRLAIPPPVEPSSAAPPRPASPPAPESTLARERALLDTAHTALGRRESARALDAVERHAREFPQGQMVEEREAIAVQALVLAGRRPEAEARAIRFRKRWPSSVLIPVIEAALQ